MAYIVQMVPCEIQTFLRRRLRVIDVGQRPYWRRNLKIAFFEGSGLTVVRTSRKQIIRRFP